MKSENGVTIKNENFDLLLRPYEDRGGLTPYEIKDMKRQKKWSVQLKNDVLPESVNEKIKIPQDYIAVTLYFNGEGDIVDATFYISYLMYEKLTEAEIRSMYNHLIKAQVDMSMLDWKGDFNYGYYLSLWKNKTPAK